MRKLLLFGVGLCLGVPAFAQQPPIAASQAQIDHAFAQANQTNIQLMTTLSLMYNQLTTDKTLIDQQRQQIEQLTKERDDLKMKLSDGGKP